MTTLIPTNTMRLKPLFRLFLTSLLTAGIAICTAQAADKAKSKIESKAKITQAQAEKTVHRIWREGKIQTAELEAFKDLANMWLRLTRE